LKPDVFINDIYSPNQMLTSRWWLGYIDPKSARYHHVSKMERKQLWKEVFQMYQRFDEMMEGLLDMADANTYIVLSSDHGAAPLNKWICLNIFLSEKGGYNSPLIPKQGS